MRISIIYIFNFELPNLQLHIMQTAYNLDLERQIFGQLNHNEELYGNQSTSDDIYASPADFFNQNDDKQYFVFDYTLVNMENFSVKGYTDANFTPNFTVE